MLQAFLRKFSNASVEPKILYGLHFCDGVAYYKDQDLMILVGDRVANKMDATFAGKPVYVNHKDDVKLDDIEEADGYVVESFFNDADGKHWAKFIVITDEGHEALQKGYKLSNSYKMKQKAAGGNWHGVEYAEEVMEGEYDHLALVPNPRYAESIILNPEQFKEYNNKKRAESDKLKNSIEGEAKMFKFFKTQKVENTADLKIEEMSVELPLSGKKISLTKLINEADKAEMDKKEEVKNKKKNEEEEEKKKKENEEKEEDEKKNKKACNEEDDDKDNEEDEEEKKKNEEDLEKELAKKNAKKKNSDANFKKLANADKDEDDFQVANEIDLGMDQFARGKALYGKK